MKGWVCQETDEEARPGPRIAHVEDRLRLRQPADAAPGDLPDAVVVPSDRGAQPAEGVGGAKHVLALGEAADPCLPDGGGADQEGPVRDRLVSGNRDVAGERPGTAGNQGPQSLHLPRRVPGGGARRARRICTTSRPFEVGKSTAQPILERSANPGTRRRRTPDFLLPRPLDPRYLPERCGAVAQLGERYNGIVEVRGSIPLGSTTLGNL